MNDKKKLNVLVFAPHPDDDLIGCGGSMAKHLNEGNEVYVVYATYGNAECQQFPLGRFTDIRRRETLNAASIMGLKKKNLFFLREYPWKLNEERIRFKFLKLVRKVKPDVCYIPHIAENHVDHKIVHLAALDAINVGPGKWFKSYGSNEESSPKAIILAYEVWTPLTAPSYTEDITDFFEKKLAALRAHATQRIETYEQGCRGMDAFRGAIHAGSNYAEVFQVLKIPRIF